MGEERTGQRVTIDFETRSMCDLKKSGAYKYSLDSTTQPTCLAAKISNSPAMMFLTFEEVNRPWKIQPASFKATWLSLIEYGALFVAHNAFFEQCIYNNILVKRYGWPAISPRQWRCTAAKAAACALPRSLEGAGSALKLSTQKDRGGYVAMMATCKPTKAWTAWQKKNPIRYTPDGTQIVSFAPVPIFLEPNTAPHVFEQLYHYCKIDVITEELLDRTLPDLIPIEQEIWFLNQRLNWRGLKIDIPTVRKIVAIMEADSKKRLKELDTLTMGLVTKPGARKSILEFLALEGVELPDIRAKTVEDALTGGKLNEDMRRLLEIRKVLSKTSTKKYQTFLARAGEDHKVRDILLYHGASTGRDTGTGIQPHNFPRGAIAVDKNRPYAAVENVIECDAEMLHILYGDALPVVFSSILRNMIVPSDGCELYVADFSKIEVAVLWWLADNIPGLKVLHAGKDPYKYQASANTGRLYEEIDDDDPARQLGKAQILGCGFGMGAPKFKTTAWDMYRLQLTEEQSKIAVQNYRSANAAVPELWKQYEKAATAAIENKGAVFHAGKCLFFVSGKFLWVELPSKRRLAYLNPRLAWKETDYGPRLGIEFDGLAKNKRDTAPERTWGGTLTENIVQAVARDLMMQASLRLEKAGYKFLLSVHDEGITERKIGEGSVEEFTKIMCARPSWADEKLPVDAKGWKGPRYRK